MYRPSFFLTAVFAGAFAFLGAGSTNQPTNLTDRSLHASAPRCLPEVTRAHGPRQYSDDCVFDESYKAYSASECGAQDGWELQFDDSNGLESGGYQDLSVGCTGGEDDCNYDCQYENLTIYPASEPVFNIDAADGEVYWALYDYDWYRSYCDLYDQCGEDSNMVVFVGDTTPMNYYCTD